MLFEIEIPALHVGPLYKITNILHTTFSNAF